MTEQNFIVLIECNNSLLLKDVDNVSYEYDNELESITSVFYNLSESFYERGIFFVLKIRNIEYVTYNSELSIFLEDFYNLVVFTTDTKIKTYDFDFYEQGARYLLSFERLDDDFYSLKFTDRDIVDFQVVTSEGSLLDLHLILFTFYSRIIFLTDKMCPSIAKNDMYTNWRSTVELLFKL